MSSYEEFAGRKRDESVLDFEPKVVRLGPFDIRGGGGPGIFWKKNFLL